MADDDFWNKRATVLRYHKELLDTKRREGKFEAAPARGDALYAQAVVKVGHVNFDDLAMSLGVDRRFMSLDQQHVAAGFGIGVIAAGVAYLTSVVGQKLEPKVLADFDRNHPADYMAGKDHRYPWGHDTANPWQKLPDNFKWGGKNVGGKSLFELVVEASGHGTSDPVSKIFVGCQSLFVHYLRDFITPAGMPLPTSSLWTTWRANTLNVCGYSADNPLMKTLGREFGSVHAGDLTSVFAVQFLCDRYAERALAGNERGSGLVDKQVRLIAYGSCQIVQLAMLLPIAAQDPRVQSKHHAAKANLIMLALFGKVAIELMQLSQQEHARIMGSYRESIAELSRPGSSFEDWLGTLR